MTLSAVYVPDTGHVVGALGLTGTPASTDLGALVGPALPLRVSLGGGETAVLSLRDRQLAPLVADDEPDVFTDPLAFGVEQVTGADSTVVAKPTLLRLASWSNQLDLGTTGLAITVPVPDATQNTRVLALVSEGDDTHVLAGEIAEGQTSVTLPVTVGSGPHGVLVLVAGWVGRLEPVTKL